MSLVSNESLFFACHVSLLFNTQGSFVSKLQPIKTSYFWQGAWGRIGISEGFYFWAHEGASDVNGLRDQSWWWAFATSQVIVPAKHHEYPTFPLATLFNESMHKKCVSNLNLHLILNILWAISSPAMKVKQKQWNLPSFPPCSLASVSPLKVLLSVFFRW